MQRKIKISAPGKVILSGEHAVVYGYPALVAAVNRRLFMNEEFEVESEIPIGCGMGSSAAYAVALAAVRARMRGCELDLGEINKVAYETEKQQHGNPSGVDNTICTYGGYLWYRKEIEEFKIVSEIKPKRTFPHLLIHNTGKPEETTREMVEFVGRKNVSKILSKIEKITRLFLKYLVGNGNVDLELIIKENERCLEELGVVSDSTVQLIREIEKAGGVAKISGAGGRKGGSGIILVYHSDMDKLNYFVKKRGLEVFKAKLGEEGVISEK